MIRVLVYDKNDSPLLEIPPRSISQLVRYEELGGERYLDITTTEVLERDWRVLVKDDDGRWHEYVVESIDQDHFAGYAPRGSYHCPWSMQHDLSLTAVSQIPRNASVSTALAAALSGTARWTVGTVTATGTATGSMYDMSGWEAISVLCEKWGCEVDDEITVDSYGVVGRSVAALTQVGDSTPSRRFDYGFNVKSISRRVTDAPVYARIIPKGMGEETETGYYGRRIGIEDVNDGIPYLQNDDTAEALRVPDGNGGWEYPTAYVVNDEAETPEDLLAWAQDVLDDYTVPKVSYTADVALFNANGTIDAGVRLGDVVQVVDAGFAEEPLRFQTRVAALRVNMLNAADVKLTLGEATGTLASGLTELELAVQSLARTVQGINGGTSETENYLTRLVERLDAALASQGGLVTGDDISAGIQPDWANMLHGTCATASSTRAKAVTLETGETLPTWTDGSTVKPLTGTTLQVEFANRNTASGTVSTSVTLDVGGTSFPYTVNGGAVLSSNKLVWDDGAVLAFVFTGESWELVRDYSVLNLGECSTAGGSSAKIAANRPSGFSVYRGRRVRLLFKYGNTSSAPALRFPFTSSSYINAQVHVGPAWDADYNWADGQVCYFEFDGQYWQWLDPAEALGTTVGGAVSHARRVYGTYGLEGDKAVDIDGVSTLDWSGNAWFAGDVECGNAVLDASEIESGVTPSSTTGGSMVRFNDKNGALIGALRSHFTSAGNQGVQLYAQRVVGGVTKWNILRLGLDASGNPTVDLTAADKAAWLEALGLDSASVTTVATVITARSGFTITGVEFHRWGKLAMLQVTFTHTAAWSAGTQYLIADVKDGYKPAVNAGGVMATSGAALLGANGYLYVRPHTTAETAAGASSFARFTYLLA